MTLTPEQKATERRLKNAEYKRQERLRRAALGDVTISITMTAGEWELLQALAKRQRGPDAGFHRRALLLGAAFAANAGAPRGSKVKGNIPAATITGRIADMSAKGRANG